MYSKIIAMDAEKLIEQLSEVLTNLYGVKIIEKSISGKDFYVLYSGDPISSNDFAEIEKKISVEGFKLISISSFQKSDDDKNPMMKIEGRIFDNKEEIEEFMKEKSEIAENDHRILGEKLGLFFVSPIVGKGLPLFTEKGATLWRTIERFVVDTEIKNGYKHVITPDIAKVSLYEKSGHYPYYKDDMYRAIEIDDDKFILRPMSCPHHYQIFLHKPRSYRDLPMRIAEMAKLYRYERSGVLSGLTRVRSFTLADAHIICADEQQAKEEINKALDLIEYFSKVFGLEYGKDYRYRLSLGDKESEKYVGDSLKWEESEKILSKILEERGVDFEETRADAAFYGPKIDIQMTSANGKEDTAFTVQYDFVMSKRLSLTYVDRDGKNKEAIVVHRSSVGSMERFYAFLIEKYKGDFPFWLSPVQVKILSVSESAVSKVNEITNMLIDANIRAEKDITNETLGKKIVNAKKEHIPYYIVIGDKDIQNKIVTIESSDGVRNEVPETEILKYFTDLNRVKDL